jgi:hypothetical protein
VLDEKDWPQREKQCERSEIVVLEEECEEVRQRVNEMTDIESDALKVKHGHKRKQ